MNNRNDKHARLLAETFHRDWDDGAPANLARTAARAARRRHAARRSLSIAAVAAIISVAGYVAWRQPVPTATPPRAETAKPLAQSRGYEIMSDDELLAQVRDQPLLALKKENGSREIIVLETGSD